MQLIAVLALSLSGVLGQAQPTATATADAPQAESCDAVRARMTRPNMSAADQNKMMDAVSECYAQEDKKREEAEAAKPKEKGVNLWD